MHCQRRYTEPAVHAVSETDDFPGRGKMVAIPVNAELLINDLVQALNAASEVVVGISAQCQYETTRGAGFGDPESAAVMRYPAESDLVEKEEALRSPIRRRPEWRLLEIPIGRHP